VTHRLMRPVNYNQDNPAKPPQYMNLVDLDFRRRIDRARVSLAIGLGYVASCRPSRTKPTLECRRTGYPVLPDDGGVGRWPGSIISCGVLPDDHPDTPGGLRSTSCRAGRAPWAVLAVAGSSNVPVVSDFPKDLQAYGNNHRCRRRDCGGLVWHILHPTSEGTAAPCLRRLASYNLTCRQPASQGR